MAPTDCLKVLYLSYLSHPRADRTVYRMIRRQRVRKILELGIGIGQRAMRMIEIAALRAPVGQVQYTGIDPFEARSSADGPGVTLKMAHRLLKSTGAKVQLVPGNPLSALSRVANSSTGTELVIISARQDPASLARAWYYFPRMLTPESLVLIEQVVRPGSPAVLRRVTAEEIARLAGVATMDRAA